MSRSNKYLGEEAGQRNWSTHQAHDLKITGSNPVPALSKGFILHHSPRRSRPRKVFEAAEAGSDNTAFLQHILDDLSENGVQSSAFKEAMNQIGLVAQSPLDQFEIVPLIPMNIGNFYFSFTNPSLFMLLTLSFFLLLIHFITKKGGGNLVPNAWQSLVELLYDFVLNLVKEQIGGLSGNVKQMFFPCILVTFFFFCYFVIFRV